MKKHTLFIKGMHCKACEMLIEDEFEKIKEVKSTKVSLNSETVTLETEDNTGIKDILKKINTLLHEKGYFVSETKEKIKVNYKELGVAFLIALLVFLAFIMLQEMGIVNILNSNAITLPTVFLIGIIASLSSCMAVVGGLVLSISSTYAKYEKSKSIIPLSYFHLSRIITFFILGGVIGLVGSSFRITPSANFVLSLLLFFVMLVLAINLLEVFPVFKKFQIYMPKSITKNSRLETNVENKFAPVILGALTFFLPCGFTQSMQFYSLTTGSFINGAFTMLVYSLGTFPILALISFASVKLSKGLESKLFFKTAGFIILFFSLVNLISALTSIGLIKPILNF